MISKKYYKPILLILLLMNPLVDVATGIANVKLNYTVSIGGIVRILVLFGLVFDHLWFLFRYREKGWSRELLYFAIVLSFMGLFYSYYYFIMGMEIANQQLMYAVRYLSFPAFFITLKKYSKDVSISKLFSTLSIVSFIYSVLIIIPYITKTGFNSYSIEGLKGSVGWFIGANEIGMIIGFSSLATIPFLNKFKYIIFYLVDIAALILVGTKAALLFIVIGFLIISIRYYIRSQYAYKFKLLIFGFAFSFAILLASPAVQNIATIISMSESSNLIDILLSGRLAYFEMSQSTFNTLDPVRKILGMGFYTTGQAGEYYLFKLVEMDFLDVFFHLGYFGTISMFFFYVLNVFSYYYDVFIKRKNEGVSPDIKIFVVISNVMIWTLIILGILIGHAFTAPSVSIFLALLSVKLFNLSESKN